MPAMIELFGVSAATERKYTLSSESLLAECFEAWNSGNRLNI
jgi:hypothetical protein